MFQFEACSVGRHIAVHIYVYIYIYIPYFMSACLLDWKKTTAIRRIAVRGTGVSRHHGAQLRGPLYDVVRSLRGALNWTPILPTNTSLSNSQCELFQCRLSHSLCRGVNNNFIESYRQRYNYVTTTSN